MKIREEAFQRYFYFIQERMNIFWKRYHEELPPYSEDDIFQHYKITNVYRILDRVSQYLVKNVIYHPDIQTLWEEDVLLNILLFKIFNKIETWEQLFKQFWFFRVQNFNVEKITNFLSQLQQAQPIFSFAYIMTGSASTYKGINKHQTWLQMVEGEFIKKRKLKKLIDAKSLEEVYQIFLSAPLIWGFLAYQYAIDMNYSPVINFSENDFVKAGIGAIRGIKKCFVDLEGESYEDAIRRTQEHFIQLQEKFGYTTFKNLFGRNPTLIDLQWCFCETDKYLRVRIPELTVGNVRIKQKFDKPKEKIEFFFPPKRKIAPNI